MKEFSHIIKFPITEETTFTINAQPEELTKIAERFEFGELNSLEAKTTIKPDKEGTTNPYKIPCHHVQLSIKADVEGAVIEETNTFFLVFSETDLQKFDLEYDVEVLENNQCDIGEIIAQYLYLSTFQ